MTTKLICFTQWAAEKPQERYTSLMGMLTDVEGLAESNARRKANKALGLDGGVLPVLWTLPLGRSGHLLELHGTHVVQR
jgi:hypothetical protein